MVETSAQCRSSRKMTSGWAREMSWKQRADLALHPLLRRRQRVVAQLRHRRFLDRPRRHLQIPGRRHRLHQGLERFAAGPVQQAVERLEDRQVGLGAGQPFRAAAARDDRALRPRRQLGEEVLDQARLADARPRPRRRGSGSAVRDARVRAPQRRRARSRGRRSCVRRRAARSGVRQRLAPLQRGELLVDLARRRPPRRVPSPASGAPARRAPCGTAGLSRTSGTGCSERIAASTPTLVGATNGRRPAAISYSTTPSANTSAAGPACVPRACSGDM